MQLLETIFPALCGVPDHPVRLAFSPRPAATVFCGFWVSLCFLSGPDIRPASAEADAIRFDLPPLAVAELQTDSGNDPASSDEAVVAAHDAVPLTVELRLSSMILGAKVPRIDQWLVRCVPRNRALWVAGYSPRTEVASELVGPVNVKRTDERNDAYGFSLDTAYGHLVRGHAGADHGRKRSELVEFQRHAPVQAVTAAGTIARGRGVYFKLRWTGQQVLEGEKAFRVTFLAPADWRGGLLDVSVVAESERRSFGGLDLDTRILGASRFTVAVYRQDDRAASELARRMVAAEDRMRRLAKHLESDSDGHSLSSLLRQVATTLDRDAGPEASQRIERLVRGEVHPHTDRFLRKLPMELRVAALEYCEARQAFLALSRPAEKADVVAASPEELAKASN